ncbi:MAG: GIY-YIG nuclease family protein [Bacteroidetes bacterium]|jgi:putative endonuclease|nr:GIY-YIG nuclease family protein [Bacteroidota bacterium]
MFWVYVLLSLRYSRSYVGQTEDFEARLAQHQAGRVKSTKQWTPWEVLHLESYLTRSEAMKREKWFKSRAGRLFIRRLIEGKQK